MFYTMQPNIFHSDFSFYFKELLKDDSTDAQEV